MDCFWLGGGGFALPVQVYEWVGTSGVELPMKGLGNLWFRFLKGPFMIFRTHILYDCTFNFSKPRITAKTNCDSEAILWCVLTFKFYSLSK